MFNGYNLMAESCCLLFAVLILFFMLFTKPRTTKVYIINYLGIILSIILTLLHIVIIWLSHDTSLCSPLAFRFVCIIFFLLYLITTNMLLSYCVLLSTKMRLNPWTSTILEIIISVCYCIVIFFLLFTNQMYYYVDQHIEFTRYFYAPINFTILNTIFCLVFSIRNRRTIAQVISKYIYIFIPCVLLMLLTQLWFPKVVLLGLTYVLPFATFYILFHNNPYDEISGTQNIYSFENRFHHYISFKKKYSIVYAVFPRIKNNDHNYTQEQLDALISAKCRQIEAISSGLSLYSLQEYTYALFTGYTSQQGLEELVEKVMTILNEPFYFGNLRIVPHVKVVAFHDNPYVTSTSTLRSMRRFLLSKVDYDTMNRSYVCTTRNYDEFGEQYKIEQMLINIRNERDLDDSRVLCYAQPIYDVHSKTFRTAEALMRLSDNGKIIYPDKFIPLAEENNCIHALTCIILNKICKKIKELENDYVFDAITINCSTTELSDPNFHQELLDIISNNQIDYSKIRLELTENAIVNDYANLLTNMEKLNKVGIRFYLDDFGTGYSNFERIISCPFMTIKFDKSLLYKAIDDTYLNDLLTNLIKIFKKKGFITLIEGVENDLQNQFSIDKGFDYIQGYMYARPVPAEELVSYFSLKTPE